MRYVYRQFCRWLTTAWEVFKEDPFSGIVIICLIVMLTYMGAQ